VRDADHDAQARRLQTLKAEYHDRAEMKDLRDRYGDAIVDAMDAGADVEQLFSVVPRFNDEPTVREQDR
jgi:hypothetical protein